MSMRTDGIKLVISGDGKQLGSELNKSERKVKTFSGKVGGMFAGVGKKISGAVGKLSPFAMIGGAAGVFMATRQLIEYQDTLSSLGITAGLSADEMMTLDKKIHDLAYTTGQSRENMVGALRNMVSDIDTEFALEAIESVSKSSTAMSMDINTAAQAFVAFRRDMGATKDEAEEMFNTMLAMDNTVSLDGLANTVATLGLTKENFGQYNALIHTIKANTGGADGAAKAIETIAMRMQGKQGAQLRARLGNDLFDLDGNIKDYRLFVERASQKLTAAQQQTLFGRAGSKAFLAFNDGKGFEAFDDYVRKGQNATFVADAFARKQGEAKFQINMLTAAAKEFGSSALGPILADITKEMTALTSDSAAMEEFRSNLTGIAEGIGAIGKIIGTVGKALGAWGDFWGRQGELSVNNSVFRGMDPEIRKELEKKHGVGSRWNGFSNITRVVSPKAQEKLQNLVEDYQSNYMTRPKSAGTNIGAVKSPEVNNAITINMAVTESGRVITETGDKNTSLTCNLNRGAF